MQHFLQFVLGRIPNTFLLSPLTSFEKKGKQNKIGKEKYICRIQFCSDIDVEVCTNGIFLRFVCYEICMPQYQMWPGSNARRMQQVFDPRPRQHWVSIIAQLQQKIFSLRILHRKQQLFLLLASWARNQNSEDFIVMDSVDIDKCMHDFFLIDGNFFYLLSKLSLKKTHSTQFKTSLNQVNKNKFLLKKKKMEKIAVAS